MAHGRLAKRPSAAAPPGPTETGDWLRWLLAVLFVASGCSALIYEIVWFQLLELVVGSSAISLGILLAVFMGGMSLGSLLLPRFVAPRHHPLRVYALLELGIGVLGVIALFEVPMIGGLYTGSGAHGLWSVVLRASIAGASLLPPTLLMGAALPAVARWVEATPRGVGWLGALYASNIAGAVVGCLLAGFYLLRVHDIAVATAVAVALNVAVALVGLGLAGNAPRRRLEHAEAPGAPARRGGFHAAHLVIGISGLCALAAEVVWTRLLSLLLGSTVYTFSIILAVFLFGLGIGSAVGAARSRSSSAPARDLGVCQLLLAAAVAWAAYMQHGSLPYWPITPGLAVSPWIRFQLDLVRCLWALLPAALLWGASFPLALAATAERGQDAGRLVAGVYVANTLGSIVGSLGFTFWIIPAFGSQVAEQLLIVLSAAAGLYLLALAAWPPWRSARHAAGAVVVVLAAVVAVQLTSSVPPLPGGLVAFGRSLARRLEAYNPQTHAPVALPNLLYVGEGANESAAVSDDGRTRLFSVSGKVEASTALRDMRLQHMLGDLPALVHPQPRSVLIVGFGAGVTSGTFVLYPSVRRIVICEIEPLIPRMIGPYFAAANHNVVSDPRVEIVYDDARHFMLTSREKFDIITSDPIHPWVKGSAALYSRDYFELVRRHLNPGGLVTQWIPLYQSSEATIRGELATFFAAFPGGTVWANNDDRGLGYDLVVMGGVGASSINLDEVDARLRRVDYAGVAHSLQELGCPSAVVLLSTYAGRHVDLAPWLVGARINHDRNLWLQYQAGLETLTEDEAEIYDHMSRFRRFPDDLFVGSDALRRQLREAGGPSASAP